MKLTEEQINSLNETLDDKHLEAVVDSVDERTKDSTVRALRETVSDTVIEWFAEEEIYKTAHSEIKKLATTWIKDAYDAAKGN